MTFGDTLSLSLKSIAGNKVRAVITALIISIGIMALVGILTAVDGIRLALDQNFAGMGATSFSIKNRGNTIQFGGGGMPNKRYRPITYNEARLFAERFVFKAVTSLSTNASFSSTVKYNGIKTDPNIMVMGGDEHYLQASGYSLASGRNFSMNDVQSAANTAIIGKDVAAKLFAGKDPVGASVFVGGARYRVIGTLKEKGNAMGFGGDRIVIVPLKSAMQVFSRPNMSIVITVMVDQLALLNEAVDEATVLFRQVRQLPVRVPDNFEVIKSDNLAERSAGITAGVTFFAGVIAFITLLGASVGLMNIMLVSVTERTREIGIRKAIGATNISIRRQFLFEAVTICQIGGLAGIVLGITLGNAVSLMMKGGFVIPWVWMLSGLVICLLVGIVSGYYPAVKASRLDAIEALRHE